MSSSSDVFPRFVGFLAQLEVAGISHHIDAVRPDSLMVTLAVPGERWEVEFMADGSIEVEVFRSDGNIGGPEQLERLLEVHGEGEGDRRGLGAGLSGFGTRHAPARHKRLAAIAPGRSDQ